MTLRKMWAAWFAFGTGGFFVLEHLAVKQQPEDTLSKVTRDILGVHQRRGKITKPTFVAGLVGFVIWFIPHILTSPDTDLSS
jgi:uncharacterized membrane protein